MEKNRKNPKKREEIRQFYGVALKNREEIRQWVGENIGNVGQNIYPCGFRSPHTTPKGLSEKCILFSSIIFMLSIPPFLFREIDRRIVIFLGLGRVNIFAKSDPPPREVEKIRRNPKIREEIRLFCCLVLKNKEEITKRVGGNIWNVCQNINHWGLFDNPPPPPPPYAQEFEFFG